MLANFSTIALLVTQPNRKRERQTLVAPVPSISLNSSFTHMARCNTWHLWHGQLAAAITDQAGSTNQAQSVLFPYMVHIMHACISLTATMRTCIWLLGQHLDPAGLITAYRNRYIFTYQDQTRKRRPHLGAFCCCHLTCVSRLCHVSIFADHVLVPPCITPWTFKQTYFICCSLLKPNMISPNCTFWAEKQKFSRHGLPWSH